MDNPNLSCLPELKRIVHLFFGGTALACLPNYGNVTNSIPALNSLPICDSANANGCDVFVWNISGTVLSETGTSIPGVTVTLSGDDTQADVTDTTGRYNFMVAVDGAYTITPSKNNDVVANNGISTIDILLMQRHILGNALLSSPYKIIAAAECNADGNTQVSTLDLLFTRQLILNNAPSYPVNRLWQFVSSDYVFPDVTNPFPFPTTRTYTSITTNQTGQDFIGIKLGDVNGSWDAGLP